MNAKKAALLVLGVMVVCASPLYATRGPQDVTNTFHNLSSVQTDLTDQYVSNNEDEVCIFCHTPHGGSMTAPLWNRATPDQTTPGMEFTHYTSATLSAELRLNYSTTRAVSDISLVCMSCHDGVMYINSVLNASNRTGAQPIINLGDQQIMTPWGMYVSTGTVIGQRPDPNDPYNPDPTYLDGRSLSDDHPISFNYAAVRAEDIANGTNKLQDVANVTARGLRFFNTAYGSTSMECSTCHDPHVNYNTSSGGNAAYNPFLITTNVGSYLCLSCHVK